MSSIESIEWRKHFRDHVLIQWFLQIRLLNSCLQTFDWYLIKMLWFELTCFETSTTRRRRRLICWWQWFHCDKYLRSLWLDRRFVCMISVSILVINSSDLTFRFEDEIFRSSITKWLSIMNLVEVALNMSLFCETFTYYTS